MFGLENIWSIGFVALSGFIAITFGILLASWLLKWPRGEEKVSELSDTIYEGAMTFLNSEYKPLAGFVVIITIILILTPIPNQAAYAFIIGAVFSALAGNIGMRIATKSNSRAAVAAKDEISKGLKIGFSSGGVMGMMVVGLALIGITIIWNFYPDPGIIVGFGFGASSIALFARVGGGIYTKSADMGADLVGKVEEKIPEDDPRNPAVIADNVGDNVGDVAGMGADLFESYAGSIISAITIGFAGVSGAIQLTSTEAVLYPLLLAAFGIFASIIAMAFVKPGKGSEIGDLHNVLNKGVFGSAIIMIIFAFFITRMFIGILNPFYAFLSGLAAGIAIGLASEYFTESRFRPTKSIAEASQTGSATNIISGFSIGLSSTLIPVISVCIAIGLSYHFAGLYGIPIAAVGMLSTLGMTLATDTYGPVNDNAAGIAEMGEMGDEVRERAEKLDAVGNTTAAIGKGFAIGSAALTAVALFSAYTKSVGLSSLDIVGPDGYLIIIGLFLGGLLTFIFSALTMSAVGKGASAMVKEVRRQFKELPGILKGETTPEYEKCIEISTNSGLKNMILPGGIAVAVPILVGLWNPQVLGGLLAGSIVTGLLLAITLANSGGAWDNAKKYIEEGHLGGKGSEAHAAAVTGDTVGDPFKDTSGPALNILIKLMSMVSLLFVPLFL
ncbi:potassium transporter [candidate division MSBL1 archaeon SCGC-AAA382A13]|uniref:Putative K(+)-stimulated pyrophosphate-energized sodium pump n=2 Tax=candidate division MSBL1 TaxID=215777 RepID=A0A133VFT5_9EURY|nr:potassium transporter [candidate division MSBL1 archaeon SCGC-AAA382A03]KXB05441.1 potassium transporter [candidate division MSBL1 archaeon SCGC-AAA382A13]